MTTPLDEKIAYVKAQPQTRKHACHWPGCGEQVPPALWGCRKHWYALPMRLRKKIWKAYEIGQEVDLSPSREYVAAARAVQDWIAAKIGGTTR